MDTSYRIKKIIKKFFINIKNHILTKRLDIEQKFFIINIVHKNYIFNYYIIFFLIGIYCINIKHDQIKNEKFLKCPEYIFHIWEDNLNKEKDAVYLFDNNKEEWIQSSYKKIEDIKIFLDSLPIENNFSNCIDQEYSIFLKYQKLYFNTLEKYLNEYLNTNLVYGSEEILKDFIKNRNGIIESLNYFNENIKSYLNSNNLDLKRKYFLSLKNWYLTYRILVYDLFYQLPDDFKKHWFKKINNLPTN